MRVHNLVCGYRLFIDSSAVVSYPRYRRFVFSLVLALSTTFALPFLILPITSLYLDWIEDNPVNDPMDSDLVFP